MIDTLVIPVSLAAGFELPSANLTKGYLTDALNSIGVLPISTYHNFITANNPNVKLLQAGQYEGFPTPLAAGTDGWQTFWALEAFDLGWYQRWQQWKADLNDFGYIKFFEQNFDTFPTNSIANSAAEGDPRYVPSLRACPGGWIYLGTGVDVSRAVVQSGIKHGVSGNSVRLIRANNNPLFARHVSGYDHSSFQQVTDNLIDNGTCSFGFWMFRPDANSSLAAYLEYDASPGLAVGLNVESGVNGSIDYRANASTWVATGYTMPTNQWTKFTLIVNLATQTYSLYEGANQELTLRTNVPYSAPFNRFNELYFSPGGTIGTFSYIDDVLLKWHPLQLYAPIGTNIFLSDSFESHPVDAAINGMLPDQGGVWAASSAADAAIENKLSFGDGFKCLKVAKNGGNTLSAGASSPLVLAANSQVTVDMDLYLRPGYQTQVGLRKAAGGNPTAALLANGTWQFWNGSAFTNTGVAIISNLWTHVQLALNTSNRTYHVAIQPVGNSIPLVYGPFAWDAGTFVGNSVFFQIAPQGTAGQLVYFDNVQVASGTLAQDVPLRISSFGFSGNSPTISFLSSYAKTYSVESASDLNGPWRAVATVLGTGQIVQVVDPSPVSDQQYYRIRAL